MDQIYERVHNFAQKYWRHVLVIVLAVIVALMGYRSWRTRLRTEEASTWQQLSQLPALNTLMFREDREKQHEEIIDTCKSLLSSRWETNATPWVLLKLANSQLAADRPGAAEETLQRLNRDYPKHYATRMATKARASLLEDMGRFEDAAALYATLAAKGQERSLFWMDVGRTRELAGDREGAIEAYEKLVGQTEQQREVDHPTARFRHKVLTQGGALLTPPPEPPEPERMGDLEETPALQMPEMTPENPTMPSESKTPPPADNAQGVETPPPGAEPDDG